jgi:hypothetical protein
MKTSSNTIPTFTSFFEEDFVLGAKFSHSKAFVD